MSPPETKSRTVLDGGMIQGALQHLSGGRAYVVQRSRDGYRAGFLHDARDYYPDRTGWDRLSEWFPERAEAVAWAQHQEKDSPV